MQTGKGQRLARRHAVTGERGATLVEVMLACAVLAILAVAGAEYLYRGQATVTAQKHRRLAMEVANSRMETIRGTPYGSLKEITPGSYATNVSIGGIVLPVTNSLAFFDIGSGVTTGAIQAVVSVGYDPRSDGRIVLKTLMSPRK